ncbi:MAG TPA: hypothetical protein VFF13_00460 [archaeon]|nr:hypothetical protein [archaeon]
MKKGQLSLDLLLTLVIAIIFFNIYIAHANNLEEQVNDTTTNGSLKAIRNNVYSVISSAKTFGTTIEFKSKTLGLDENNSPIECTINIEATSITVSSGGEESKFEGLDISGITINGNSTPQEFECDTEVTLGASP